MFRFVYVIGLHAVKFGNNWMRKIPRTAKLDEAAVFVVESLFKAKLNVRAKTIQFILNWTVCIN